MNLSIPARSNSAASRAGLPEGGIAFDGSTSGTLLKADLLNQSPGVGDFTLRLRLLVPVSLPAGTLGLAGFTPSATQVRDLDGAFGVAVDATGALVARLWQSGAANWRELRYPGFVSSLGGQWVDAVLVRSVATNSVSLFLQGQMVPTTETAGGTAPAWSSAVTSSPCYLLLGGWNATELWNSDLSAVQWFNLALSGSQIESLLRAGIPTRHRWGTQVRLMDADVANGGFETLGAGGADVFANWSEAVTGTSSVAEETAGRRTGSRACKMTVDAAGSAVALSQSGLLVRGRSYRVACWAKYVGGTPGTLQVQLGSLGDSTSHPLTSGWARYVLEGVANASGTVNLTLSANTPGSVVLVDQVEVEALGAVQDLDMAVGKGTFFPDRSTNRLWAEAGLAGWGHRLELDRGEMVVTKTFAHGEISLLAGTTRFLDLPAHVALYDVEFDREQAFDAGTTLEIGTSASPASYVGATNVATTGKGLQPSSKLGGASTVTTIYLRKNQATSTGRTTLRARCVIRGG